MKLCSVFNAQNNKKFAFKGGAAGDRTKTGGKFLNNRSRKPASNDSQMTRCVLVSEDKGEPRTNTQG